VCVLVDVWVFLVPIAVLSYAVLILIVRGVLGAIGTFFSTFSNRIWDSHSPPLWSPVRSFRQFGPNQIGVGARPRRSTLDRLLGLSLVAARTRPLSRVTTARGNRRRWWHESIHSFWAGRIVPHLRSIFMILCFQTKYLKMRSSCPVLCLHPNTFIRWKGTDTRACLGLESEIQTNAVFLVFSNRNWKSNSTFLFSCTFLAGDHDRRKSIAELWRTPPAL